MQIQQVLSRVRINEEEIDMILAPELPVQETLPWIAPAGCIVCECGCMHNKFTGTWFLCVEHEHYVAEMQYEDERIAEIKNKIANKIRGFFGRLKHPMLLCECRHDEFGRLYLCDSHEWALKHTLNDIAQTKKIAEFENKVKNKVKDTVNKCVAMLL